MPKGRCISNKYYIAFWWKAHLKSRTSLSARQKKGAKQIRHFPSNGFDKGLAFIWWKSLFLYEEIPLNIYFYLLRNVFSTWLHNETSHLCYCRLVIVFLRSPPNFRQNTIASVGMLARKSIQTDTAVKILSAIQNLKQKETIRRNFSTKQM